MNFAKLEAKLTMITILSTYNVHLFEGDNDITHKKHIEGTLKSDNPVYATFTRE